MVEWREHLRQNNAYDYHHHRQRKHRIVYVVNYTSYIYAVRDLVTEDLHDEEGVECRVRIDCSTCSLILSETAITASVNPDKYGETGHG
jgi:hypothetical protein